MPHDPDLARCEAKLVCRKELRGTACTTRATETFEGHALCWTHWHTILVGMASLEQVLGGFRGRNPYDNTKGEAAE